jgi:hypothetical protein
MKKILFLSLVLTLLVSLSFAQDNKIKQKAGDKEGSEITEYGINKNQPISAGEHIYKNNIEPIFGHHSITDYFYDGIENNSIKIKTCSYLPVDVSSVSSKKLTKEEMIKQMRQISSGFSVPLNSVNQAILNVSDGSLGGKKLLLIRVVTDSKILVNEIEVKPVPGIKYDNKETVIINE